MVPRKAPRRTGDVEAVGNFAGSSFRLSAEGERNVEVSRALNVS